ncbi:MAG: hypothetical protein ACREAM_28065, partial [Blastocatellia bacterium]
YTDAGNFITLTASGTGGTTATADGPFFGGGTIDIPAENKVTIGGAAGAGKSATAVIDGVSVTYSENANDTIGTVAAMLATAINAHATLSRYIQAIWTPTLPNQVLLRSKLGLLVFATGLSSAHSIGEIVAHVHLPFADRVFGALTRSNIVENSFKYPLASRQTTHNKFVIQFNDAVQDYQATKLSERDEDHIDKINREVPLEISGACVDNYHQAARLVIAERYKRRQGHYFNQWTSAGVALLLEEGDVVCMNHSAQPGQRNLMLRVEELRVTQNHRVNIVGRLYADAQFPTTAEERTVPLTTGIGWVSSPPPAISNVVAVSPVSGTLEVTFTFGGYIGAQEARVETKFPGEADFTDTGIRVNPSASLQGTFQLTGVPSGVTQIRITPFSAAGDGPATIYTYDSSIVATDILERQIFDLEYQNNLEVEVYT